MALPVNKIGANAFMALLGQLSEPRNQHEIDQRPGVDGTEILHTRKRGVPFTLISIHDCQSYALAQTEFHAICAGALASSSGALEVIQTDFSTLTAGYLCKVLDIRLVNIQQSAVIVGGLNFTSGAILTLEWTLLGITV
jgi:hypothetical protein